MKTLEELKKEFYSKFVGNIFDATPESPIIIGGSIPNPDEVWQFIEEAIKEERDMALLEEQQKEIARLDYEIRNIFNGVRNSRNRDMKTKEAVLREIKLSYHKLMKLLGEEIKG